ncbi:MAG: permease-like cell division protein FtsX, partial [Chromatiales bacterium]|nr:permease-like cell division protein FtsX [Chromatiales bacterium]
MARRKNRPIRKTRTGESKPARRNKASSQSEKRNNPLGSYLLRHLQNFLGTLGRICRHPVSSLMTMSVIGIALALPAALYVVVENGRAIVGGWDSVADLSVYLDRQVSAEAADELARALRDEDGVAATKVIYADEALEQFREL